MARIPTIDQINRPGVPRGRRTQAGAESFGAIEGRAQEAQAGSLARAGEAITSIANQFRERRQQAEDQAYLNSVQAMATRRANELFESSKLEAAPDARGFTDSLLTTWGEQSTALLEEAQAEGGFSPSQDALLNAEGITTRIGTSIGSSAVVWENNTRVEHYALGLDQTLQEYASLAATNPENLDLVIQSGKESIERMRGSLPVSVVEEQLAGWDRRATEAALLGLIEKDPASALDILGGTDPTGTFYAAPRMGTSSDELVRAVATVESGGRQHRSSGVVVESSAGAVGIMQVLPSTGREMAQRLGIEWSPERFRNDADYNMMLGRAFLDSMLERYDGNTTLALAAYNAGPGRVDEWVRRFGDPRSGDVDDATFAARIPFDETRRYVGAVLSNVPGASVSAPAAPEVDSDVALRLTPERRVQLMRSARSEVRSRQAAAQAGLRSAIDDELASVRRTGTRAGVVSDDQILSAFPDTGAAIINRLDTEAEFFRVRQEVATATPAEDAAILASLAPQGEGFAEEADRFDALLAEIQDQNRPLLEAELASVAATGERAGVIDDAAIRRLYPDQGDAIVAELERQRGLFAERQELAATSPEEDALRLQGATIGGADAQADIERRNMIAEAVQAKRRALEQDPAQYVLENNAGIRAAFEATAENPAATPAAVRQLLAEQERLGVPAWEQRALPAAAASALAAQFATAGGARQMAGLVESLSGQYGDMWPKVYGELAEAGLPSTTAVLAGMSAPGQGAARIALAEAIEMGRNALESNVKGAFGTAAVTTDIPEAVSDSLTDLRATLEPLANGATLMEERRAAVELLALRYASAGEEPSRAARRAANDIVNSQYAFRDTYRVPVEFDPREVGRRADALLRDLTENQLLPPPNVVPSADETVPGQYLAAVRRDGVWATNEEETGLLLLNEHGEPVQYTNGERVEVFFDPPSAFGASIGRRAQ